MENYKGGLKRYWKKYERLDEGSGHRRKRRIRIEQLGGRERNTKKKFWRIKMSQRLRLLSRIRRLHPKRILARIRDGYVRTMQSIAGSSAISGSGYGFGSYGSAAGFGRPVQMKEYDERMIVQIYKSILTQSQLVAAAAEAGGGSGSGAARIAA